MKSILRILFPKFIWNKLGDTKDKLIRNMWKTLIKQILTRQTLNRKTLIETSNECGFNISRVSEYYSVLPVLSELKKNMKRWYKPSSLSGIKYDIEEMEIFLKGLVSKYATECRKILNYNDNSKKEYGHGIPLLDAMLLYFMIRDIKPKRYLEVGSGHSTLFCSLAAEQNAKEGKPLKITCIEPHPYEALYGIPHIEIIKKEAQDVDVSAFEQLDSGDVLFIDSTHIVKIDGDVPYLFLEVIPRLKKGVIIHIHDIPFPYNVPFPAEHWIFGQKGPFFFNEAMLLQALLCHSDAYKILISTPLLRFYDEDFLRNKIPDYEPLGQNPDTFSSIWIKKIK